MGDCKCCNDLGSSPKCQLFNTICVTVLFVILGVYGISIINYNNRNLCPEWNWEIHDELSQEYREYRECWNNAYYFKSDSQSVAYYAGFFVSIVCMVTCVSRCCAPCCCQLSDVPSPCTSFGLLDLCFFVGFIVAMWPVNFYFTIDGLVDGDREGRYRHLWWAYDLTFHQFADVILLLGILMLCVAIPLGCVKFKRMQEKGRENPSPSPQVPQVVGSVVVVKEAEAV